MNHMAQPIEASGPLSGMVWIPGGTFRMGSADFYPVERPVRDVTVDGFWMDRDAVSPTISSGHLSRRPAM